MIQVTSTPSCKQAKPLPSLEVLDQLLIYDPDTGVIRWRKAMKMGGSIPAGTIAGSRDAYGYRSISLGEMKYKSHRLAFKMYHRREPVGEVDHRDTDKGNNRITNLREAVTHGNNCNVKIRTDNTSGVKGVSWSKHKGKWQASLSVNRKQLHVGYFNTIEDATAAVRTARQNLHGEFSCHG